MTISETKSSIEGAELAATISREAARKDILSAFANIESSVSLAWWDIKMRYKRTLLGPFWITISTGVFVFSLGLLYSQIFGSEINEYLPYLAAGFVVWNLMAQSVTESPAIFIGSRSIISSMQVPLLTHIVRHVSRHTIIFIHTLIIIICVELYVGIRPNLMMLLAIPGLILLVLNVFWMSWLLALLGARYRDISPVLASIFQLMFFLTPIIWQRSVIQMDNSKILIEGNPFYHLVNIVRAPILGKPPDPLNYYVAIGLFSVGSVIAYFMFLKYRRRVAYWI